MESSEFRPIFAKFSQTLNKLYKGSYSCDNTPNSLRNREFFIINTDSSAGLGRHWLCLVKISKQKVEIFNSLGTDDEAKQLYNNVCLKLPYVREAKFNLTQVQSSNTSTCGRFCIYFLIQRIFNFDIEFDELVNELFSDKTTENEERVEQFFIDLDLVA